MVAEANIRYRNKFNSRLFFFFKRYTPAERRVRLSSDYTFISYVNTAVDSHFVQCLILSSSAALFVSRHRKLQETVLAVKQLDTSMKNLSRWLSQVESQLSGGLEFKDVGLREIQAKLQDTQVFDRHYSFCLHQSLLCFKTFDSTQ